MSEPVAALIDPRAIIDPTAIIGTDVHIGAWSVIGEGVAIGDGARISTQVVVQAGTRIGDFCSIGPQTVVGSHPLAPATLAEVGSAVPLELGANATLCSMSRVVSSVAPGTTVAGSPAVPVVAPD